MIKRNLVFEIRCFLDSSGPLAYKSRNDRDRVNAKVMKDPRLAAMMNPKAPIPFDLKRMSYGGFPALVDL